MSLAAPSDDYDDIIEDLASHGIAEVPFDGTCLQALVSVFNMLPIEDLFSKTTGHVCEVPIDDNGAAKFVVAHTAVTDRMRWLWACDEVTLKLFDVAAQECLTILSHVVGVSVSLCAACFVVVLGPELTAAEVKEHKDWGHPKLHAGDAFTCLTPLVALPSSVGGLHAWPWQKPEYVHAYRFGTYVAIDGKLLHRTEPFAYCRDREPAVCDNYEAGGHLRVLVSLSIASDEPQLAPYVNKVLRGMAPAAALVRGHLDVFLDSQSEQWTSDEDTADSADESDDGNGIQSIRTVLQNGLWTGELSTQNCEVTPFELELAFDLREGTIYHGGRHIGSAEGSLSSWHAAFTLMRESGDFQATGEFVRTPVSVLLQGKYQISNGLGGTFGLYPPAPWRVEIRQWERLQLPKRVFPVPLDFGVVDVTWKAGPSIPAGATRGRAARWCTSAVIDVCGPVVALMDTLGDHDLTTLTAGCIVLVSETAQSHGNFERLLAAAVGAEVGAVVLVIAVPRRLPRAGRRRPINDDASKLVPCVTVASTSLRAGGATKLTAFQGLQMRVQRHTA